MQTYIYINTYRHTYIGVFYKLKGPYCPNMYICVFVSMCDVYMHTHSHMYIYKTSYIVFKTQNKFNCTHFTNMIF